MMLYRVLALHLLLKSLELELLQPLVLFDSLLHMKHIKQHTVTILFFQLSSSASWLHFSLEDDRSILQVTAFQFDSCYTKTGTYTPLQIQNYMPSEIKLLLCKCPIYR